MSEEILKALTQLFAILSKQDYGASSKERDFVIRFFNEELDQDSVQEYLKLYDELSGFGAEITGKKRTSVSDSVKTLAICKKINKTLTQKQKIVVLIKIMELITSDQEITQTESEILKTVAEVFNFTTEEYREIENFVFFGVKEAASLESAALLVVNSSGTPDIKPGYWHIHIDGNLVFLKVTSENMYFLRYFGQDEILLNGFVIKRNQVYLFSNGSIIRLPSGEAIYYSELVARFNNELEENQISFLAEEVEFRFPGGSIGLRDIHLAEYGGKLIGIMGSSGAGKTTLLNVLAGLEKPTSGTVKINGIDIFREKDKVQGVIGYVSQDDLLIEDLTVYQNLYYNAKFCFGDLTEEAIDQRVNVTLKDLGLDGITHLKVGSPLNKKISGGQRKRLNIALELIREPAVLFVDEPTSGLSSRDSENVIDLLKELSLKGKLIFVVIHQPSSEIYKMFDKMYILDVGGYPVYYGDPVEAVSYFKEISRQVDKQKGMCKLCGNVNPEQIFNILDAKVVDEYGQETVKRKMRPEQWYEHFRKTFRFQRLPEVEARPQNLLNIPNRLWQAVNYTTRDFFSKVANSQYLILNFTEAPLLALILTWITRYINDESGQYQFRDNDNIPIFFLMSIIVALFLGLTVSAEEILRDKKILKRESFLNLSWNSYLMSKLFLLFSLSAIQTFTFVLISTLILEIHGMFFTFWAMMFTVSCFANVVGLVISAAFNSPVTVYILIPIILIPQMILSGLMFPFDKLNKSISSKIQVPLVADLMASRWAVEGIFVEQYVNNPYEAPFYKLNKTITDSDYKSAYLLPELKDMVQRLQNNPTGANGNNSPGREEDLNTLKSEIKRELPVKNFNGYEALLRSGPDTFNPDLADRVHQYLDELIAHYQDTYNSAMDKKNKLIYYLENRENSQFNLNQFKDKYHNEKLTNIVRNLNSEDRIYTRNGNIYRLFDPVYNTDFRQTGIFNFRTHFYAPYKPVFGFMIPSFYFNFTVIWIMTIITYIALYLNLLPGLIESAGRFVNRIIKLVPINNK